MKTFAQTITVLLPLWAAATGLQAQNTTASFSITGKAPGIDNDTLLFNRYTPGDVVTDTVLIQNETFVYKGQVASPAFTSVKRLGDTTGQHNNHEFYFFTEKGSYTLNIQPHAISQSTVSGAVTNQEYFQYQQQNKTLLDAVLHYTYAYLSLEDKVTPGLSTHDTLAILNSTIDSLNNILFKQDVPYIQQNNQSYFSLYLLAQDIKNGMPPETAAPLFDALATELRLSDNGLALKTVIDKGLQYAIGNTVPALQLKNAANQPVNLMTIVRKNKYTLIDIWASWCVPCRAEFPFLKQAYARYHPSGFEIYALSVDMFKKSWTKALSNPRLPWVNVITNNNLPAFYQVNAIPFNLLVNNKGVIVGRDLRGEKLDRKLRELLH